MQVTSAGFAFWTERQDLASELSSGMPEVDSLLYAEHKRLKPNSMKQSMLKHTVDQLQQENAQLKSIIASLAEGVIVADQEGRFVYFNPAAKEILGIGMLDIAAAEWTFAYGCFLSDKVTPFPVEQLPLARAIRGEHVHEERIYIRNGARPQGLTIEVTASPLVDKNGFIQGGTIIFRDITAAIAAEELHRESEIRLTAQFRGFPIPTYVWQKKSRDFILIDYNDSADQITNGNIKNYLGVSFSRLYADAPEIRAEIRRCFRQKMNIKREISYRMHTTGENKVMSVTYVYIPPDLILVHTEDITDQRTKQRELRQLSSAVEQTADSVIITDRAGAIEYINQAFEKTTGFSRQEAIGQNLRILKSGKHDQNFYQAMWSTILQGNIYQGLIINRKKNGELYWCAESITPMRGDKGEIDHFVCVLKDVTETRKRHEQEFQMRIAREVQQRLLGNSMQIPGYDIAGATFSAVETSGDYYDVISQPGERLLMVVGDVSGHGIGPALIMAETRAFVRALARHQLDPGKLLTELNRELTSDLDAENFVTLVAVQIDLRNRSMRCSNAGHLPATVIDSAGHIAHTMESTGVPLGFLQNYTYTTSAAVPLTCGDLLVLLTDGVTEAIGADESPFGLQHALDWIIRNREKKAGEIAGGLNQVARNFYTDALASDDITSLVCKVE